MTDELRSYFEGSLLKAAETSGGAAWRALEEAHVLSQPWPRPHVRAHLAMLRLAIRQHDAREALGQVVRLVVAGPGSVTGRYPVGNSGRARVSMTKPMPVPEHLERLLREGAF